jgi:hypothetical protein
MMVRIAEIHDPFSDATLLSILLLLNNLQRLAFKSGKIYVFNNAYVSLKDFNTKQAESTQIRYIYMAMEMPLVMFPSATTCRLAILSYEQILNLELK